jgi:transposase
MPIEGEISESRETGRYVRLRDGIRVAQADAILQEVLSVDARFVGLNATSQSIEVAIRPTGELWKTDFADETINETAMTLKCIEPKLVVMEGTGNFELPVAGVLATVGLPITIVNPRSIREFARAVGRISRFDMTQAGLLAYFGELVNPDPRPLPDELIQKLKDLRTRRDDVQQMLLLEKSRLDSTLGVLRKDVQRHITFLEQSISLLNQEFSREVRGSAAWR